MGIFDFFKRKNDASPQKEVSNTDISPAYKVVSIYNEYTKLFVNMMASGNYAPIAAYEKTNGEIIGYLYITKDESYSISIAEVITAMKAEFSNRMQANTIKSYAIYYHSVFNNDNNHAIADEHNLPKAISIILKNNAGFEETLAISHQFEDDGFNVGPMTHITPQEFQKMLAVELQEGKDYFQERIEREPPTVENEFGVIIKTVNNGKVGDFWGGMFGFEFFREMSHDALFQYMALARTKNMPIQVVDDIQIHELNFNKLSLRTVSNSDDIITSFPTVQTNQAIDVSLKQIDQWEHSNDLEAIVYGGGRDTFAIRFYATDYAFNRKKYLSNTKVNVKLSAILYVLDKHTENKNQETDDLNMSPEFCMYMPSQESAEFGCYDFIGKLEYMEEANYLDNDEHSGYILRIKLINNEEIEDFFTIDMFVNKKNMRFTDLQIGMKLTGMFQLFGELAN